MSALDRLLPVWDERSRHELLVRADPARVDAALRALTFGELRLTGVLMTLRGLRGPRGGRRDESLIASFLDGAFELLVDEPGRELAVGLIAQPWRLRSGQTREIPGAAEFVSFREPGFVRAVMGFAFEPETGGTRLVTETRIQATDPRSRRAFARYWRVISLGSGLIRRDILRAVRRRAE